MAKMIYADACPCLKCNTKDYDCYTGHCEEFTLWRLSTVDAVEVVHGRWVKDGDFLICLNCESEINVKNSLGVKNSKNYCPNCGAKMDGDGNG